jgi:protein required for attachment to host cells
MYRACIAVVDASRARLFTYQRTHDGGELHEELTEERAFVNPARRRRPSELFSDSGSSSGRSGPIQFGTDDHRDAHVDHLDSEFSRMVAGELEQLVRANTTQRVILCASPRMLGELRDARNRLAPSEIPTDEVARDLVKLTPPRLRAQLASYGLLPEASR